MAKAYTNQLTAIERIRLLNNYGGRNAFYNSAALIYEDFVADLLARRFPSTRRLTDGSSPETSLRSKAKPKCRAPDFFLFKEMRMSTLYKPSVFNYPFVDFYYKDKIVKKMPEDAFLSL